MATAMVHDTKRPRAGRRFEPTHERALHGDALKACESLPGAHRGVVVVREMTGPIGIPDLTALVGDPLLLEMRLALDIPPILNQLDAGIVAATPAGASRTPQAIAATLRWPLTTVKRRIPGLVRTGALMRTSSGSLRRVSSFLQPAGRLYAVEAKVNDRAAAIHQARTYSVWTDSYVLVMGSLGGRALSQLLSEVSDDHGGLMVASEWLRRPVIHPLDDGRRLWASEHFVAAVRDHQYQPSVLA